ncbi:hypothetical protein BY458DRAFT_548108 [Sporodiniella umbellata]|nr:hypothetical protein BY458DRAFT_548108 [Sporodiniella umbellata]
MAIEAFSTRFWISVITDNTIWKHVLPVQEKDSVGTEVVYSMVLISHVSFFCKSFWVTAYYSKCLGSFMLHRSPTAATITAEDVKSFKKCMEEKRIECSLKENAKQRKEKTKEDNVQTEAQVRKKEMNKRMGIHH